MIAARQQPGLFDPAVTHDAALKIAEEPINFGDVGRAWFEGGTQPGGLGWLRDIGAGLRIAPTRTSHANTIRFDIAFPLDGDPSIEKVQYLVSTSERF